MRGKLGDKIRLQHIADAISEIEQYLDKVNFAAFTENSMMRFACIKQLEIIGEASNHISKEMKKTFSEIEWQQIAGMRNVFIHEYFGVDLNLVWDIIVNDLPLLRQKITDILLIIDSKGNDIS
jgi:uncharacterized protein with HEPN domain